jgi:hypothetical protein
LLVRAPLIAAIAVTLAALPSFLAPALASAYTMLTVTQREQILESADLPGPERKTITDPACIGGRLSTIDPRWAAASLTNTHSCVRRYGGASGESVLFKRSSADSVNWRIVGNVSETCTNHEAGAPDKVLRDLGCAFFEGRARPTDSTVERRPPTQLRRPERLALRAQSARS